MAVITKAEQLNNLKDNSFIGVLPSMRNSSISFNGHNNILYCEEGVHLVNSSIKFNAHNSICYLSKNKHSYLLNVTVNNNNVFYMGENSYINGALNIALSEEKHLFIGDNGLFSFGIWIRNADPHLIYDCDTMQRINPTKSIYLGDHVWLGQSAMILKGTQISSGSIIGAMSVVSGKKIPANSSWAGNPVKCIKERVFWDGRCVHLWDEQATLSSQLYKSNNYVYNHVPSEYIPFDEIDRNLSHSIPIKTKLDYLIELSKNKTKNRFVAPQETGVRKRKRLFGSI